MSNSTVSWKPDPDFRGTFNILSTCIGTLLICVWSAVHDDIPKGKRGFMAFLRRIGWLFVGLLAPEMLLYIAFSQHVRARRILREAEQAFGPGLPRASSPRAWWSIMWRRLHGRTWSQLPSDDELDTIPELPLRSPSIAAPADKYADTSSFNGVNQRKHPWTLTHAFFAAMGGFKLDGRDDEGECYLPAWQGEAMISPEGIMFLLRHAPHLIPDIPVEEIEDRSKADGLAKALLVWQVLWFCLNSGSRLVQGLPLSLLEVSTIAHGVSTLITYAFWWAKPLNIKEPILVGGRTKEAAAFGAWMSIASDAERNVFGGISYYGTYGEHYRLTYVSANSMLEAARKVDPASDSVTFTLNPDEYHYLSGPETPSIKTDDAIRYRFSVSGEQVVASPQWPDRDPLESVPRAHSKESYVIDLAELADSSGSDAIVLPMHYSSDEVLLLYDWSEPWRWLKSSLQRLRANVVYRRHPAWDSPVSYDRTPIEADPTCLRRWRHAGRLPRYIHLELERIPVGDSPLVVPIATLQSSLTFIDKTGSTMSDLVMSTILPAAYGTPHLLGWNATFPTNLEKLLWRTAALAVTASGFAMLAFGALLVLIDATAQHLFGMDVEDVSKQVVQVGVIPLGFVLYVAASGYLLVESFRQLFALPPAAFQLASWANSIPHFT